MYTPFRFKRDNLCVWPFYDHLWSFFCHQAYGYKTTDQNLQHWEHQNCTAHPIDDCSRQLLPYWPEVEEEVGGALHSCILIMNPQSEIQILNELYSKSSPIYCNQKGIKIILQLYQDFFLPNQFLQHWFRENILVFGVC